LLLLSTPNQQQRANFQPAVAAPVLQSFFIWFVPLDVILIVLWAIIAPFKNTSGRPDSRPA
jgi:hypothetical protein